MSLPSVLVNQRVDGCEEDWGGPGGVVSRWGNYILPFLGAKGRDMLILLFKVGINIRFLCLHLCFIVFVLQILSYQLPFDMVHCYVLIIMALTCIGT